MNVSCCSFSSKAFLSSLNVNMHLLNTVLLHLMAEGISKRTCLTQMPFTSEELFDVAIPLLKAETQESQSREVGSFFICTIYWEWLKPLNASKIISRNGESRSTAPTKKRYCDTRFEERREGLNVKSLKVAVHVFLGVTAKLCSYGSIKNQVDLKGRASQCFRFLLRTTDCSSLLETCEATT